MLYNLKNGKTIELTIEEFFRMSDAEVAELDTLDVGEHIEDPFSGSALAGDYSLYEEDNYQTLLTIPRHVKLKEFHLQD